MVKVTVYRNSAGLYTGFDVWDHAEYAEEGADIICAAVSALTINCINSIERLTDTSFEHEAEEADARIRFRLKGAPGKDADLLMQSFLLGIQEIENNYSRYVDLIIKEV
ncbi:MAG: ribosomal-processing cysteine protease Prp [Eubacterium sp.]|jgi:uncharacterized protein YsxB (DUF464 family)